MGKIYKKFIWSRQITKNVTHIYFLIDLIFLDPFYIYRNNWAISTVPIWFPNVSHNTVLPIKILH